MARQRKRVTLEYKKQIVSEYLSGTRSAQEIADSEGIERGQIYKWKVQLDNRARSERVTEIEENEGVSPKQARRIQELEDELLATQKKLAQLSIENDLLKKLQPNSPFAKSASGYIETKAILARSRGRAK